LPAPHENTALHIAETSLQGAIELLDAACAIALQEGERSVVVADVGNLAPGLNRVWQEAVEEIATRPAYNQLQIKMVSVGKLAKMLIEENSGIEDHDLHIIAGSNLAMDILSDLGAALGEGGIGNAPGAQIRRDGKNRVYVAEAVGGTAWKYTEYKQKGLVVINPTALIRSAILMLRLTGFQDMAGVLEKALKCLNSFNTGGRTSGSSK